MMMVRILSATLVIWSIAAGPSASHDKAQRSADDFDRQRALALSRAAIGREVRNVAFRDRAGRRVELATFRGRPVVVSLIYTSCVHVCPTITARIADAVEVGRDALGKDGFSVVTIGFDTRVDTPDRMAYFADRHGLDDPAWKFLAADTGTIRSLADDLGFVFFRSPNGFDHLAQTTVIDSDGRVAAQVYGESFQPPALIDTLKRLAIGASIETGMLSGLIDRIRLFCTVYDPTTRRYGIDYSILVAAAVGIGCLGVVAVFLARGWLDDRRRA